MAVSTIMKGSKSVFERFSNANATCNANGISQQNFIIPAKPGYSFIIIDAWTDGTGTTSQANADYLVPVNRWGDARPANQDWAVSVVFRNLASSAARFTANISVLYIS